jgi:type IV secretion system protein TrbJ
MGFGSTGHGRQVKPCRQWLRAVLIGLGLLTTYGLRAETVFDPWNFGQNLLTASRALEQINTQVRSLETQTQLLIHSTRNLANLPTSAAGQLKADIGQMNQLFADANGLSYKVETARNQFHTLYPRQYSAAIASNRMVQDASARWTNSYEALRQTLLTQSKIAELLDRDQATLATLMANSSAAVGALQVQQAGNELAALHVKQSVQAQALVMAQSRAAAMRDAEQQASAEGARERFARFIGDGHAYSKR